MWRSNAFLRPAGNCSALRRLTATTMPSSSTALYVLPDTPLPSTSADALRRLSSRSSSPPSKQTSPPLFWHLSSPLFLLSSSARHNAASEASFADRSFLLMYTNMATETASETVMSTALPMPVAISAIKLRLLKPPLLEETPPLGD